MTDETSRASRLRAYLQSLASQLPMAGRGEPPESEGPLAASAMAEWGDLSPPQGCVGGSTAAHPRRLPRTCGQAAQTHRGADVSVITQFDGPLIEFGDGLRRHRRT